MRREHITLPTLQVAAAAFFFTSVQAKVKCVDGSSTIVQASNCDGTQPSDSFFLVPGRDSNVRVDSTDLAARAEAGFPETGLVAGGFGRRQEDSGSDDQSEDGSDDEDDESDQQVDVPDLSGFEGIFDLIPRPKGPKGLKSKGG